MSEEKKSEVTEDVKETCQLSEEDLEQVNGGAEPPDINFEPVIVSPTVPAGGGW